MVSIPSARMDQIAARHAELSAEMARPDLPPEKFVALSKEYAELTPVAEAAAHVRKLRDEQDTLRSLPRTAPPMQRCGRWRARSWKRSAARCRMRSGTWRSGRSEEHTSELQSLMRISYAVFCLKKQKTQPHTLEQTI